MGTNRVNYDEIARTYDQRYAVNQFAGIAAGLLSLVQRGRVHLPFVRSQAESKRNPIPRNRFAWAKYV
jgi:hypothetical protein